MYHIYEIKVYCYGNSGLKYENNPYLIAIRNICLNSTKNKVIILYFDDISSEPI